jgi:hypothetical protein
MLARLDKDLLLERLRLLRSVLAGTVDATVHDLARRGQAEGGDARTTALELVEEIGHTVYEVVQAEKEEQQRHPFGFAQWTRAGQRRAA